MYSFGILMIEFDCGISNYVFLNYYNYSNTDEKEL
jgi:hypothetical protein